VALGCQFLLEDMEDFRAHAHGVLQRFGADRHDHEFLEIDRVVGMGAAVDDVHHRNRQDMGVRAADITVERQAGGFGRGLGDGERDAEDGIGAETRLVRRAVEGDHRLVDMDLAFGVETADRVEDLGIDRFDRLFDALAVITLAAVTQLDGFVRAGGGARRNGRAAHRAVFQIDIHLDGRIAAAVEDFAGDDIGDGGQGSLPGFGRRFQAS